MLDLALKNVFNRKARTFLSVIAVAAAVILYINLNVLVEGQRDLLEDISEPFEGKVVILQSGKGSISPTDYMIGLRSEISNDTIDELLSDPEVMSRVDTYELCYVTELYEGGYAPSVYLMGVSNFSNPIDYMFNNDLPDEAMSLDISKQAIIGGYAAGI